MNIKTILLLVLTVILAVGCAKQRQRIRDAEGVSPTLDAAMISNSTQVQDKVFMQLLVRAGLCTGSGDCKEKVPADGNKDWGKVVEAGFGFVDELWENYMDALFWYNRFRNTTSKQLSITGAMTASVLGILDASSEAIAITAASFGFSSASFENLSGTLLYDLDPSGIKTLVDRARFQYRQASGKRATAREDADKKGFTDSTPMANNRPEAIALIQGYLSLCLPAYIETQVNNAVAATDFKVIDDPSQAGSLIPRLQRVDVNESQALELNRYRVLEADKSLPVTPKSESGIKNALTPLEKRLSFSEGIKIQEALCVKGDGNFGTEVSETRKAIKLYQTARGEKEGERDGKLSKPGYRDALLQEETCIGSKANYLNAYEKFEYNTEKKFKDLLGRINNELKTQGLPIMSPPLPDSIVFDGKIRAAIRQIQQKKGKMENPGELTRELDDEMD